MTGRVAVVGSSHLELELLTTVRELILQLAHARVGHQPLDLRWRWLGSSWHRHVRSREISGPGQEGSAGPKRILGSTWSEDALANCTLDGEIFLMFSFFLTETELTSTSASTPV